MEFPVMSSQAGGFSLSLSECASEVLLENFKVIQITEVLLVIMILGFVHHSEIMLKGFSFEASCK